MTDSYFDVSVGFSKSLSRKKLQKRFGARGVVALLSLWGFCVENRSNGELCGLDRRGIALAADYTGEDWRAWVLELIRLGFLGEGDGGVLFICGWGRPLGYYSAEDPAGKPQGVA